MACSVVAVSAAVERVLPTLQRIDAAADRTRENFVLLDLYLISLFRYEREGSEKNWRFLRFFQWSSGVGELDE